MTNSPIDYCAGLSEAEIRAAVQDLTLEAAAALLWDWTGMWARSEQLEPPGDWDTWLIQTGRGWGKTRTGAEYVRRRAESGLAGDIGFVGATAADVRDVMIEGPSGILQISPPDTRPFYEPSKRRVTWRNGVVGHTYSADEPNRLRGPQHCLVWADELAAWRFLGPAWDNLVLGLRVGSKPRLIVTTTPRPLGLLRELMQSPRTHLTRGATYDNADNLAPTFLQQVREKYEGTRVGRQELYGEYLDDVPGALWTRAMLDNARSWRHPAFVRVVVAVDPAVTSGEDSDDTGIVVGGLGIDGHAYVLQDATCHVSPLEWAKRVVRCYDHHQANLVVGEVNNGGDLVEANVHTVRQAIPFRAVHATRGKMLRAEPVSSLYEQGRVHHVVDADHPHALSDLEDQLCNWSPLSMAKSPDRLDALVWLITELLVSETPQQSVVQIVEPVRIGL